MHETMKRFVHDRSRCQRPDIRAVVPRFPSARLVRTTLALLALTACSSPRATSPGSSTASRDITITRRDAQQTSVGPAETFTGTVRVQRLFLPTAPSRMQGAYVTFEPGAHTA
jgi:hypothetical protein